MWYYSRVKIYKIYDYINKDSELFRVLKYLPKLSTTGPWLAGGSVWKAIENIPLECDLDLFFSNKDQCAEWYRTMKSIPYTYRVISEKTNTYNTTLDYHIHEKGYNKTKKIQCVSFTYHNDIENLLCNFDFTACQFCFDGTNLYTGDTSLEDLRARRIVFNNIRSAYSTERHLEKYKKLGFTIPPSEKEKFKIACQRDRERKQSRSPVVTNPCGELVINEDSEYPRTVTSTICTDVDLSSIESILGTPAPTSPIHRQAPPIPSPVRYRASIPTPPPVTYGGEPGLVAGDTHPGVSVTEVDVSQQIIREVDMSRPVIENDVNQPWYAPAGIMRDHIVPTSLSSLPERDNAVEMTATESNNRYIRHSAIIERQQTQLIQRAADRQQARRELNLMSQPSSTIYYAPLIETSNVSSIPSSMLTSVPTINIDYYPTTNRGPIADGRITESEQERTCGSSAIENRPTNPDDCQPTARC